jgi:hypothetical protein
VLAATLFASGIANAQIATPRVAAPKFVGGGISTTAWSATNKNNDFALSNGNLTATAAVFTGGYSIGLATSAVTTAQKRYFEVTINSVSSQASTGLADSGVSFTYGRWLGESSNSVGYENNGNVYAGGSQIGTVGTYGNGAVISVAVDFAAGKVWFRLNGGNWDGNPTDNPATNTGGFTHGVTGDLYPGYMLQYDNTTPCQVTANFGATAFTYTPPSGFSALP